MTKQNNIERRKKIIKQLNKFGFDDTLNCCVDVNDVVNWHLSEIDRIVEPLKTIDLKPGSAIKFNMDNFSNLITAIQSTISIAK